MAYRWIVWTGVITLLAALLLMPLRVALAAADLERLNLSARQVGGSIWNGRIGDLTLGRQLLGTFDVSIDPAALLLGRVSMKFDRLESLQGPLAGTLRSGGSVRGFENLTGRLPASGLFAPVPVEALDFDRTTILFDGGRCARAEGRISARLGVQLGPIDLSRGFSGPVSCEGERVRARLATPSGLERLEFYVDRNGRFRSWLTIRNAPPETAAALSLFGFSSGPDGMTLSVSNSL